MQQIAAVDMHHWSVAISRDLRMAPVEHHSELTRSDGLTVGVAVLTHDPPHAGERHPDGDELILVISGRIRVSIDSQADNPLGLGAGDACIIRKGEWHRVNVLEPTCLLHITPGPRGDHRPLNQNSMHAEEAR